MKKAILSTVIGIALSFSTAFASSSFRIISGVGYGLVGVEYEYGQPNQNLAYSGGVGFLSSGSATGVAAVGGVAFYFDSSSDRSGPFAAMRVSTGVLDVSGYSVTTFLGIVTAGYRFTSDHFDLAAELGVGMGTASLGYYSTSGVSPAFGISIGIRP